MSVYETTVEVDVSVKEHEPEGTIEILFPTPKLYETVRVPLELTDVPRFSGKLHGVLLRKSAGVLWTVRAFYATPEDGVVSTVVMDIGYDSTYEVHSVGQSASDCRTEADSEGVCEAEGMPHDLDENEQWVWLSHWQSTCLDNSDVLVTRNNEVGQSEVDSEGVYEEQQETDDPEYVDIDGNEFPTSDLRIYEGEQFGDIGYWVATDEGEEGWEYPHRIGNIPDLGERGWWLEDEQKVDFDVGEYLTEYEGDADA